MPLRPPPFPALFLACAWATAQVPQKLALSPARVLNESTVGYAGALVDEQDLAGDPAAGHAGKPATVWDPGWDDLHKPASAVLDLGRECRVASVYLYDGAGNGAVTLYAGPPFHWRPLFTDSLNGYNSWNRHALDTPATTRFLRLVAEGHTLPLEVVVYGVPAGSPPPADTAPAPHTPPTLDKFLGANSFVDDPVDRQRAVGALREYHNWTWTEGGGSFGTIRPSQSGQDKFNPSFPGWDFDAFYRGARAAGLEISPAIQGGADWLTAGDQDKPVPAGADPLDPASYRDHARHLFQYAARYGNAKVSDGALTLAAGQPRLSGLGLIRDFEDWNEQDRTWGGRAAYFNPYEYAAMASADRDGHRGALGPGTGVKAADPGARLVMGGLVALGLDYLKAMKFWADWNRGGDFPADVVNLHHYSNDAGEQGNSKVGVSPEADSLLPRAKAVVDWVRANLPGRDIWITEFGYDTHAGSPQRAPAIGSASPGEVQGQWLVRSYLALAAAGVDRACMYMLRDVDTASGQVFATSGLTTAKGEWAPKPSWYYVYTLKVRLAGMRFAGEIASGDPKVRIYAFRKDSGEGAYALWCPTSEGAQVKGYRFALPGSPAAPKLVRLTAGDTAGTVSALTPQSGAVALDVDEKPILVLADRVPTGLAARPAAAPAPRLRLVAGRLAWGPLSAPGSLEVTDARGRLILRRALPAGPGGELAWPAAARGLVLLRLRTPGGEATLKVPGL